MTLKVKVRVTADHTREVLADIDRAVEEGLAAAVPGIVALADRKVRRYSDRIADGLMATRVDPLTWLIISSHHAAHIAESGARHAAAFPTLVPALLQSRGDVVKRIQQAMG